MRILFHVDTSFSSSLPPSLTSFLPPYLVKRVGHAIETVEGGEDGGVRQNHVDVRNKGAKLKLFQVTLGGGREGGREGGVIWRGEMSTDVEGFSRSL